MAKHPKPEEIVAKLRQEDVLISQGQSVAGAIRAIGVSEVPAGRTPQRRDLLHTSGGTGRDRKLALSRQHHQTARLAGLPTSSSRGVRASLRRLADPVSQVPNGGHTHRALTFKPAPRGGADQRRPSCPSPSHCPSLTFGLRPSATAERFTRARCRSRSGVIPSKARAPSKTVEP